MGIQGLLPLLKSIHKPTTLKKFAGQTIGIDGYGWLHRGTVACAIELALDKPTTKYIDFAVSRVRMLLDFGIIPYVVFDGDALPSKAGTNEKRRASRNEAKALGLQLYKAGKISQASQELQKAAGVTPYMARLFIEELKKMDVQYVVAPFEADAQLAYLENKGIIDGILSEDSDLLVFGAKRLITKLNQYGECVEIERADFRLCKDVSLSGFTDAQFRKMAILSGCDYLPNIEKLGLKTAHRFVRKYKDTERVLRMIAFEGKFVVPQGYSEKFNQAELTFLHHRVFCPIEKKMVFLTELTRGLNEEDMPYIGAYVEPEIAIGVACGDLNPKTKQPLEPVGPAAFKRPQLRDNRRQTLGTPNELKSVKSIDSFFKAQRTPLAELDPNSLTPSPSQQRLLERHRNASWDSQPVNSAPQLRRAPPSSSSIPTQRTPSTSRTDRSAFLERASTISNYQPPKRQRLCSESDEVSPSKEVKHSPFFSSNPVPMSPLNQKKARTRKSKRDFDVWSDDSVDDAALLSLLDVEQVASPVVRKTVEVSTEVPLYPSTEDLDAIPQSSPVPEDEVDASQKYRDINTQSSNDSSGVSQNTVISNVSSDDGVEAFDDLLEYHVRKQKEALSKTFVGQTASIQMSALQGLTSSDRPSASKASTAEARTFSAQSAERQSAALSSLNVVKTSEDNTTMQMLKTFVYQSPEKQKTALDSLQDVQSDAEKVELARMALARERRNKASGRSHKTSVLSPPVVYKNVSATSSASDLRGSEDAIVPNSEDEGSEEDEGVVRPRFNLKEFTFKA